MTRASIADYAPIPAGSDQYPLEFIEHNKAIKLSGGDREIVVGLANGAGPDLLQTLQSFHRAAVCFVSLDPAELSSYLSRALAGEPGPSADGGPDAAAQSAAHAGLERAGRPVNVEERERLDRLAHDAPIVNLVNSMLIDGIRRDASDVHIEAYSGGVRVRYRLDGVLHTASTLSKEAFAGISSRIKVMANLNIMERRLPQDGRITVHLLGRVFDIRVSIVPIADGESIVLRLFDRTSEGLALSDLGFDDPQLDVIRSILRSPHGLFLVTGPTGSGKTTTLTAIVRELRSHERKIITIEDPVEYRVDGVDQIQTNESIGLTFASLLRRVLRQDPDMIMVGEIRDAETAALAVRAALTGHLVLASLHTNDAVSSIIRLANMGVEPYLVAGVLRGVVAQRLVRRVCRHCSRMRPPTGVESKPAELHGVTVTEVAEPAGCGSCRHTGYSGRTAVAELFAVDDGVESLVARGAPSGEIEAYLTGNGTRPLVAAGMSLVARGVTTVSEIERIRTV